jgi:cell division protein FtsB
MTKLLSLALFLLFLAPACALDRREYEELKNTQDEFRAQLAELRQANETINRNITVAIQELEALKAQLAAIPPRTRRLN